MRIHDLKNNFNEDLFQSLIDLQDDVIKYDNHRNIDNYKNIADDVEKFDCFEVLTPKGSDEIIAFSGLYNNNSYPENCARSCTRTYNNPKFRSKFKWPRYNEDYFIPYELGYATKLKYEYVFISVELKLRRRVLANITNYLENNLPYKWTYENRMYNTCRQHNDKGDYLGLNPSPKCYQNVTYTSLINNPTQPFLLPSISMEEYDKNFSKTQVNRLRREF